MRYVLEHLYKKQELYRGIYLCRREEVFAVDADHPAALSTSYEIVVPSGVDKLVVVKRGSKVIYEGQMSDAKNLELVEGDEIIINLS